MVGCDSFGEIKEDSLQEIDCPAESTLCEESRPGNKVSSASKILKSRDLVSMATISRAPKAIYKPTLSQIPDTLMTTGTPDDLASKMESSLSGDESRIAAQDLSAVKPSDLSGSQKPTNVQSLSKQLENDDLRRRLQSFIAMKAMEAQGEASNPPQPQPQPVSSPNVLTNTPLQATCTRTDLVDHPVFSNLRQLLTAEKMTATSSKSNTEPPSANLPDLVPLDQQLMSSDGEDSALFGSQQTFTALLSEPLVGHEVTVETDQALGVCRGDELSPLAAPVTSPSLTALPPLAPDLLNQCSPPPEPLTPVASQTTGEIAPDATPSLVQLETADVLANGGVEAPGLVLPGSPPEQTSMSGDQLSPGSAEAWDPSRPAPHQLPPCKVCGVQATGFHYGVNTCEACKGFFRRSIVRKQPYVCANNPAKCSVKPGRRNICPACRYKKCVEAGMAVESIKIGRYTYAKRTKDLMELRRMAPPLTPAALKRSSKEHALDQYIESLVNCHESRYPECQQSLSLVQQIQEQVKLQGGVPSSRHVMLEDFMKEYCATGVQLDDRLQILTQWMHYLEEGLRLIVSFAKDIPGFKELQLPDQMSLIKHSISEVWVVSRHKAFHKNFDYFTTVSGLTFDVLKALGEELGATVLAVARLIQKLDLSIQETIILKAACIFFTDRCELLEPEKVDRIQEQLFEAYIHLIKQNHPKDRFFFARTVSVLTSLRNVTEHYVKYTECLRLSGAIQLPPLFLEIVSFQ